MAITNSIGSSFKVTSNYKLNSLNSTVKTTVVNDSTISKSIIGEADYTPESEIVDFDDSSSGTQFVSLEEQNTPGYSVFNLPGVNEYNQYLIESGYTAVTAEQSHNLGTQMAGLNYNHYNPVDNTAMYTLGGEVVSFELYCYVQNHFEFERPEPVHTEEEIKKPWYESVGDFFESAAATVANFTTSTIGGIVNWGESVNDFIYLKTDYAIGQIFYELGFINESELQSGREEAAAYVAIDGAGEMQNIFYEETEAGNWIDDNFFASDIVRNLGNGIGYSGMNIAMSAVAGTPGMLASAFISGFGSGAETAYQNGATYNEGMLAGALQGTWDGVQYFLGAKIQGFNPFQSQLANSLTHIGLDAADGGVEGFVQPFIQSTYLDGYINEDGIYVEFTDDMSFNDKYAAIFESNGGWENVAIQATIGAIFSSAGEMKDMVATIKNAGSAINVSNTAANIDFDKALAEAPKVNVQTSPSRNSDINNDFNVSTIENISIYDSRYGDLTKYEYDPEAFEFIGTKIVNFEGTVNLEMGSFKYGNVIFNIQKDLDLTKMNYDLKDVYNAYARFAYSQPDIANYVYEINITSITNPADPYWRQQMNDPYFVSEATGGNGVINIYAPAQRENLQFTLAHEATHCFDGPNFELSNSEEWNSAIILDNYKYPSDYAMTSCIRRTENANVEDLADSVAYIYKYGFEDFKCQFPNRAKVLEQVNPDIIYLTGGLENNFGYVTISDSKDWFDAVSYDGFNFINEKSQFEYFENNRALEDYESSLYYIYDNGFHDFSLKYPNRSLILKKIWPDIVNITGGEI